MQVSRDDSASSQLVFCLRKLINEEAAGTMSMMRLTTLATELCQIFGLKHMAYLQMNSPGS